MGRICDSAGLSQFARVHNAALSHHMYSASLTVHGTRLFQEAAGPIAQVSISLELDEEEPPRSGSSQQWPVVSPGIRPLLMNNWRRVWAPIALSSRLRLWLAPILHQDRRQLCLLRRSARRAAVSEGWRRPTPSMPIVSHAPVLAHRARD